MKKPPKMINRGITVRRDRMLLDRRRRPARLTSSKRYLRRGKRTLIVLDPFWLTSNGEFKYVKELRSLHITNIINRMTEIAIDTARKRGYAHVLRTVPRLTYLRARFHCSGLGFVIDEAQRRGLFKRSPASWRTVNGKWRKVARRAHAARKGGAR